MKNIKRNYLNAHEYHWLCGQINLLKKLVINKVISLF